MTKTVVDIKDRKPEELAGYKPSHTPDGKPRTASVVKPTAPVVKPATPVVPVRPVPVTPPKHVL
jgi:hypothetical protein